MNSTAHEKKNGVSGALDRLILGTGRVLAWANGLLILVIVLQVTLRYGFGRGLVMLEELEWHLYSLAFMFGLAYALVTNAHVRVDMLPSRFSPRTREWIEAFGTLLVLMPFIVAVIYYGIEFFWDSWIHHERSSAPMGMPYRWAIKAVIPLSFFLLGLAAFSRLIKAIQFIRGK